MAAISNILVTLTIPKAVERMIRRAAPDATVTILNGDEDSHGSTFPSDRENDALKFLTPDVLREVDVVFGVWGRAFNAKVNAMGGLRIVAPKLRWLQLTTAGSDHIGDSCLSGADVCVTTVGDAHSGVIAEFVAAMTLYHLKGIPRILAQQQRHEWIRFVPRQVSRATVGIVGLGGIGSAVARLMKSFGCRVVACRRRGPSRQLPSVVDQILDPDSLPEMLSQSDVVVVAVPLTDETRGMIGDRQLRSMKPSAILLNVARGPIVDQTALVAALSEGRLAGAALDVFDPEPVASSSELWDIPNLLLTPHISAGTEAYDELAAGVFVENLERSRTERELTNIVQWRHGSDRKDLAPRRR